MKESWICEWEIYPDTKSRKTFKSYEAVYGFVRGLISEKINVSEAVSDIKSIGDYKYINAIADFLEKYIKDPAFPGNSDHIPSDDTDDYSDCDTYPEDCRYGSFEGMKASVSAECFSVKFGEFELSTNFVLAGYGNKPNEDLYFSFYFPGGYKNRDTVNMELKVECKRTWGSSAHAVMVLQVLQSAEKPLTRYELACEIYRRYNEKIERKAVGRMIALLKDLGYEIKSSKKGFVLVNLNEL